jgi:hypothetical protein
LLERVDAQFEAAIRKRAEDALREQARQAALRGHRSNDKE